jgi:transcription antitermination factor NusG
LRVRGYEVLLPCYQRIRRWADRTKRVERALFEGYVFCRSTASVLARIISTPCVIRIVGDGRQPSPMPEEEIEAIQRIMTMRLVAEPWPYLQAGQRVRIEAGPLKGTEGIILSVKDHERFVVSVSLLQRSVAVELHPDWLTSASSSPSGDWRHLDRDGAPAGA